MPIGWVCLTCRPSPAAAVLLREFQREHELPGIDSLAALPGLQLVPKEPAGSGYHCDISLGRCVRNVFSRCYSLLVDLVEEAGWDAFLAARSVAFLMDELALRQQEVQDESEEEQEQAWAPRAEQSPPPQQDGEEGAHQPQG